MSGKDGKRPRDADAQPLIPPFGRPFAIQEYDPGYTANMTKDEALEAIVPLRERLNELQNLLYADRSRGLLVVLQAIDTGGKDSTVNSVFADVGPIGCRVVNYGVPNAEELAHDYLWRYHRDCPQRGFITVFNRSHYESVVVERVKEIVPASIWKRRYEQINAFEQYLESEDTIICKFFLHISKDEQQERLQERIDNPRKHWKFRRADLDDRKLWDDYQGAFEDMIDRCNMKHAPWHVVPADHKWYRDVVIAKALVERLEAANLRYPPAEEGIEGLTVK